MGIKMYTDGKGLKRYMVSISVKSKVNPSIRKQKKRRSIESKAKAERIEKALYEQAYLEVAALDGEGYTWGEIIERWNDYKKHDQYEPIADDTRSDYYAALKSHTSKLLSKPAKSINRADIKLVLKDLEANGKSKSFQAKMKGTISRVYNWGLEESLIKGVYQSPTFGISVNRKTERVPTILNKEEIFKLLNSAKALESAWYPIWAMALLTGCRNGELYALTWDDVNFSNSSLRVSKSYNKRLRITKTTKAGYWRNIPINNDLKGLLLELKAKSLTEFILPRIRSWEHGYQAKELNNFCKGIGITPIRFHDLRACFATQLLQNKVPPATVMKICGWRDMDTMGRYIRLAGIDEAGATDTLLILPQIALNKVIRIHE